MIRNPARFQTQSGREVFTGQELLIKGAWEAPGGLSLMTGTPGAPWNGLFRSMLLMDSLFRERNIRARPARHERLAVAEAHGAAMAGCRAMVALSGQGMQRAAETIANALLSRPSGRGAGVLVAVGDDVEGRSIHAGGDCRALAEQIGLPMLEPSCPQEVKDWVSLGLGMSREAGIWMAMRLTPLLLDGGGTVFCYRNHQPASDSTVPNAESQELSEYVPLPSRRAVLTAMLHKRRQDVIALARTRKLNRLVNLPERGAVEPLGFIAGGSAYAMLTQALAQMGVAGRLPICKLGLVWPLDEMLIRDLASRVRRLVVVEEGEAWIEPRVQSLLACEPTTRGQVGEVFGRRFPDELTGLPPGPLHPSELLSRLGPLLERCGMAPGKAYAGSLERIRAARDLAIRAPARHAGFCPGCPHRDSSSVLLELQRDLADGSYMLRRHQRKPVRLFVHGDTGCSSLMAGSWQSSLFQSYGGVGLAGAMAAGVSGGDQVRHIALMGDAAYFHTGWSTIAQAVENGQNIMFILLANQSAAMSGRVGLDRFTEGRPEHDVAARLKGSLEALMIHAKDEGLRVARINPADRQRYRALLERLLLEDGVRVLIADKECGLQHQAREEEAFRRQRAEHGFEARRTHVHITESVCDFCLECTTRTGCQGLKVVPTDAGPKIQTDEMWCVSDGACHRIRACPSFCEVTVLRTKPTPIAGYRTDAESTGGSGVMASSGKASLPDPPRYIHGDKPEWRAHLAGVGGTGIGVATSALLVAGHLMGYHVQYLDRTDPAPRTGSVSSQVLFTQTKPAGDTHHGADPSASVSASRDPTPDDEHLTTPRIPFGHADVIFGLDLVEVVRAVDPRQGQSVFSEATVMAIQPSSAPTLQHLIGIETDPTDELLEQLASIVEPGRMVALDLSARLHEALGTRRPLNIALLGLAYQLGWIPVTAGALEQAVARVVPQEAARALRALNIGREAAMDLRNPAVNPPEERPRATLMRKVAAIRLQGTQGILTHRRWFGRKRARRQASEFREYLMNLYREAGRTDLGAQVLNTVTRRAADCMIWGGIDYARLYGDTMLAVLAADRREWSYALTRLMADSLAHVMLIKDEFFVAALLTQPERYLADQKKFAVDPLRGDSIRYRFITHPSITLWGRTFRFDWRARAWQLRLLSRLSWLRRYLKRHRLEDRQWRDSFIGLLKTMSIGDEAEYQRWLAVAELPLKVRGFGELRRKRIRAARKRMKQLLDMEPTDLINPGSAAVDPTPSQDWESGGIELTVSAPKKK
ncbi:MAG: 2-oxoacid:acceptor oxidoreductase family protein [Phycisphaeraceae bacterium]|nr:2-oxoacid:acceptor oxidoreductase family protein [Phycisphaeraceae bacterium]